MKKALSILLVLIMALAVLTGCGGGGEEATKFVIATDTVFAPFEFTNDAGEFVGIDVEIAEAIAEKLGMELKIEDVEFGSIIGGVQSGKFDMGMAGMTVTEKRLESVNFSTTYATGIQVIIVADGSAITSLDSIFVFDENGDPIALQNPDIKVGVQQDTTGDIYCSSKPAEWGFGEENVVRYKTGADAVQALITGKVTAVIIDNEPAKAFVAANKGLKIQETSFTEEDYAIAINKEDTELLKDVNAALAKLTKEGKIQAIIDKYIK